MTLNKLDDEKVLYIDNLIAQILEDPENTIQDRLLENVFDSSTNETFREYTVTDDVFEKIAIDVITDKKSFAYYQDYLELRPDRSVRDMLNLETLRREAIAKLASNEDVTDEQKQFVDSLSFDQLVTIHFDRPDIAERLQYE